MTETLFKLYSVPFTEAELKEYVTKLIENDEQGF